MYLIGVAAARIALILLRSQLRADLRRPCSELGRKRGGGKRWNRRPLFIVRKLATPGLKAPIGTLLPEVEQDEQDPHDLRCFKFLHPLVGEFKSLGRQVPATVEWRVRWCHYY